MAKPWKVPDFDPRSSFPACIEKILRVRYEETFSHEVGALSGGDVEALHDMRVSARRLKAMMKVFKQYFPGKKFRVQYAWIGNLIRSLGAVRDCDVFISLLEEQKISLSPGNQRAIDLLIARQKTVRHRQSKSLQLFMRTVRAIRNEQEFIRFLAKAGR